MADSNRIEALLTTVKEFQVSATQSLETFSDLPWTAVGTGDGTHANIVNAKDEIIASELPKVFAKQVVIAVRDVSRYVQMTTGLVTELQAVYDRQLSTDQLVAEHAVIVGRMQKELDAAKAESAPV